ncbi:MAG: glycosyltransferase family 9 protein [Calditrichaeota bacterium]|nr:glycosyltransferase family 9 protein [Calditrichota bacterium]
MSRTAQKRFLVVRTDRLGDLILSLPVLSALKQAYPGCVVGLLVAAQTAPLVEGHPDVDILLTDDPHTEHRGIRGWARLVGQLRMGRFDTAILLHPTLRLALALTAARIPQRLGTAYRAYSLLFTHRVPVHRKGVARHELDLNFDLLSPIAPRPAQVAFNIPVTEEARAHVRHLLAPLRSRHAGKLVVIHPGSGGSARDWPLEHFARLADELTRQLNATVVVTGSAQESQLVDRLWQLCQQKPFRLDGRTSLKELAALLGEADLVVSNSTGPLHLAVAVGTEVIGFYCRIRACAPERWGPYGRPDSVLTPEVEPCERCTGARCPDWDCMSSISVEQALALAARKMNEPHAP